jgi:hypothetical protein
MRVADIAAGKLAQVHQSTIVKPNINEGAEVDYIED